MAGAVCRCIQRFSLSTPIRQPASLSLYKLHAANYSTEPAEKKELTNKELVVEKIKVYVCSQKIG